MKRREQSKTVETEQTNHVRDLFSKIPIPVCGCPECFAKIKNTRKDQYDCGERLLLVCPVCKKWVTDQISSQDYVNRVWNEKKFREKYWVHFYIYPRRGKKDICDGSCKIDTDERAKKVKLNL